MRRSLEAAGLLQPAAAGAGAGAGGDKKEGEAPERGGVALPPILAHNLLPLLPQPADGEGGGDGQMRGLREAAQSA